MIVIMRSLIASLFLSGAAFAADFHIITHPENAALQNKIASDDLKDIFVGKKSVFDNGTKIQPARLSGAADEAFIGTVFERSVSRYEEILKKILFSGTAVPPKVFSSEEQMLQHVKANSGAIGVVGKAGLPGVRYLEIQD